MLVRHTNASIKKLDSNTSYKQTVDFTLLKTHQSNAAVVSSHVLQDIMSYSRTWASWSSYHRIARIIDNPQKVYIQ